MKKKQKQMKKFPQNANDRKKKKTVSFLFPRIPLLRSLQLSPVTFSYYFIFISVVSVFFCACCLYYFTAPSANFPPSFPLCAAIKFPSTRRHSLFFLRQPVFLFLRLFLTSYLYFWI